ncbi:MAG: response regulator transcription factor [Acidimicrobiales bacterium]|nr:response regulator transcription factor [Acidimicrobiales bacterium]
MDDETTDPLGPNPEPVRVLICDDHALFRRGLMMVLEEEVGVEVVAEAENGAEAVAMAEDFAPDVVLMDVAMPGIDGIGATRQIALFHPSAKIIMLAVNADGDELFDAIRAGATTYLLKETAIEHAAAAVRSVVEGQTLPTPELALQLLEEFDALGALPAPPGGAPAPALAARERVVLERVAAGESPAAIADDLSISEHTVRNHLRNVLGKLHAFSRSQATTEAGASSAGGPAGGDPADGT